MLRLLFRYYLKPSTKKMKLSDTHFFTDFITVIPEWYLWCVEEHLSTAEADPNVRVGR